MLRATLPVALAALGLGAAATGAHGAGDARFLVPVTADRPATIGDFVETQHAGDAGVGLRDVFGAPSSQTRQRTECVLRWPGLGLWVQLTNFAQHRNPCTHGYFARARLRGSRWHTPRGLRIGSSTALARNQAVCGPGRLRCHTDGFARGYVLGVHRIDCAPGLFPNVVAATSRGHVVTLWVYTHSCE